jgi:DsbC/DsbD-like thiol-disulfide interchange protein
MSDRSSGAGARAGLAFACNLAVLAVAGGPALAADASQWDGGPRAAMRLIAGDRASAASAGTLRAGIEIRLGPGWKTYWRYAGDSGVPPRFRFDRSDNVATATVLFPAPHGFTDESGESIGYKDRVILPVRVVPRDAGKPVVLRLDVDYAICEKLCVPIEAKAELALPGDGGEEAALAASEARVPRAVRLNEGDTLSIRAIRREDGGARPRIVVDVAAPTGADLELFAEGPTPEWSLPVPAPLTGAPPGLRRFAFELDGLPPGASAHGAALRLTAVTAEAAIEVTTHLD